MCVYVFMCLFVYVFVTLNGQRVRIAFQGCIWCGCQRNSLKLRIATFYSLCKHGITARVGAPGNGNAVEQRLAFTSRAGVNVSQKSKCIDWL